MYNAMQRSAVKTHKKSGKTITEIAAFMGMNRKTVSSILDEPTDRKPQTRDRKSRVDPFREQIRGWIQRNVPVKRMLELAKEAEEPYEGSRSEFYEQVRKLRKELKLEQQEAIVRFEGVPGEYCQIDWGELRNVPFLRQPAATRYFFAARLKFSRMSYVEFTTNMKLETLIRCMLRAFAYFGGIPWVCVFDNMKTVTIGRDEHQRPIWNPTFLKFVFELETHPLACWPESGNQKGSVENLVGFVKSNFWPERSFLDDADLARQVEAWLHRINHSVNQAHGEIPMEVLDQYEKGKLTPLQETADNYGIPLEVQANLESLIHVEANRYSVPVGYVGRPLLVRLRKDWVDVYDQDVRLARHARVHERQYRPIRIPEHYEPVFAKKPRARVMLYRDHLMEQDASISSYICELCYRHRDDFGPHILAMYELLVDHGASQLGAACAVAGEHAAYGADYLQSLLRQPPDRPPIGRLEVPAPSQEEVDRALAAYQAATQESGW